MKRVLFVDPQLRSDVDLSSVPSGTTIVLLPEDLKSHDDADSWIVCSHSFSFVEGIFSQFLAKENKHLTIMWNIRTNPYFTSKVAKLPNENFTGIGDISGEIASFEFRSAPTSNVELPAASLEDAIAVLLDRERTSVSVPKELFRQLIWRYNYLLIQYGTLAEAINSNMGSGEEQKNSLPSVWIQKYVRQNENNRRELVKANSDLVQKKAELEHKYEALANSKLGRLQLKYWQMKRRNGAKND